MKKTMYGVLLVSILCMSMYKKQTSHNLQNSNVSSVSLTEDQMAIIQGKGCNAWQWAATVGAWIGCFTASGGFLPVFGACLAAVGGSIDCIDWNVGGPTGPPTACDPCPLGGYEEEYSLCQQIGGQIVGSSQCSMSSQRICCQD